MTIQQQTLFAFGLGYSAQALAQDLAGRGWRIIGTSRSQAGAARLRTLGHHAHVFDALREADIPAGAHWLISVPPDRQGCPVARSFVQLAQSAGSITYLSTTGVYGDLGGGWAFEWSPINPGSPRSRQRVLAEDAWQAARPDARLVRLPGIYGPGRSGLDRLREGSAQRIVKPGQVFSRVHVEDIAGGLDALLARPQLGGVFHLCDDEPAPSGDVITYAAHRLGLAAPPEVAFEEADLSAMARSFYAECKRISNARTKAALGWHPLYRTYRSGLDAILAAETAMSQRPSTS